MLIGMAVTDALVSVVMPTYNRLPYLRDSVDSVLRQTCPRWELIVVDDGSTDETAAYLSGLRDRRVHLVEHSHCGNPAQLRNIGIERAMGEYVAFLDSDDLWHARKLELQMEALRTHAGYRWSYTGYGMVDEFGNEIPIRVGGGWTPRSGSFLPELVMQRAAVPIITVLVERALLSELGRLDETLPFLDDYDLALKLMIRAEPLAVSRPLSWTREHPGRSTARRSDHHEVMALLYSRFRATVGDRRILRLCDAQCASYLASAAKGKIRRGQPREALRIAIQALGYRRLFPRGWWTVVRCLFARLRRSA